MSTDYHEEVRVKNTIKLRKLMDILPKFVKEFFRGIENRTSSRTRIGYAHDLHIFFEFITQNITIFMDKNITELELSDLDRVKPEDIEEYLEYLNYYVRVRAAKEGSIIETELGNEALGKSRKLSSLRSMYIFFYKRQKILTNPTDFVDFPKKHLKNIVKLEPDEVSRLLDEAESGDKLTKREQKYHEYTRIRDIALLSLLLGTGMRISECIGINIDHINFEISGVKVTRKGGKEAILYFGDEVVSALSDYLDQREKIIPQDGHEDALFLSMQRRRITDRAVQNLVKKYARLITTMKKITPHKLRSTFGTTLYNETNDIYLVASVLGHIDVNTTKKYYAAMDDNRIRKAAKVVKLRD